jgi:hypothetical protein
MIAHEVAGVLIATVVAVAFISAIQPGSQMGTLLSSSLSGWSGVLNSIRGTQPGA